MKNSFTLTLFLLLNWTALFGQPSHSDSVCYGVEDLRKIAAIAIERDECKELLALSDSQIVAYQSIIAAHKANELLYNQSLGMKDSIIGYKDLMIQGCNDSVKKEKKRTVVATGVAGLSVLLLLLSLVR